MLIEIALANCIPSINLADAMPKNGVFYYDISHYTNEAAEKVASILGDSLNALLRSNFPAHFK